MFSSRPGLLGTFLAFTLLVVVTVASAQTESKQPETSIEDLLIEKRDVIANKLEYAKARSDGTAEQAMAVMDVERELLDAKLALAESPADRIAILEARVENRRSKQASLQQLYKLGAGSYPELADVMVQRIDAEVALKRATEKP